MTVAVFAKPRDPHRRVGSSRKFDLGKLDTIETNQTGACAHPEKTITVWRIAVTEFAGKPSALRQARTAPSVSGKADSHPLARQTSKPMPAKHAKAVEAFRVKAKTILNVVSLT